MYIFTNYKTITTISNESKQQIERKKRELYNINEQIRAPQVRLVGDNIKIGIYSRTEALSIAQEQELDLVEISASSDPPVCKIIDYGKFKYIQKKKQKQIQAKSKKIIIKEIRLSPNTSSHDIDFKLKHATSFLQSGAKVKVWVKFQGREIVFKERGELLLLKFAQGLEEYGTLEQLPKLEGKRMSLMISPMSGKQKNIIPSS